MGLLARPGVRRALVSCSSLLAALLILELALRFLPVSTGLRAREVNAENATLRFAADRSFVYSKGLDFQLVNRGRVNNFGFVNDQDYEPEDASPPARSGLAPERIVLVVDGLRRAIYEPELAEAARASYFGGMRDYLMDRARANGYEVVDMHPLQERSFAERGTRFEFPTDNHWNADGHGLAADAVLETSLCRGF